MSTRCCRAGRRTDTELPTRQEERSRAAPGWTSGPSIAPVRIRSPSRRTVRRTGIRCGRPMAGISTSSAVAAARSTCGGCPSMKPRGDHWRPGSRDHAVAVRCPHHHLVRWHPDRLQLDPAQPQHPEALDRSGDRHATRRADVDHDRVAPVGESRSLSRWQVGGVLLERAARGRPLRGSHRRHRAAAAHERRRSDRPNAAVVA